MELGNIHGAHVLCRNLTAPCMKHFISNDLARRDWFTNRDVVYLVPCCAVPFYSHTIFLSKTSGPIKVMARLTQRSNWYLAFYVLRRGGGPVNPKRKPRIKSSTHV